MIDVLLTAVFLFLSSSVSAAPSPASAVSPSDGAGVDRRLVALCAGGPSGLDKALGDPGMIRDFRARNPEGMESLERYGACRSLQGASDACSFLSGVDASLAASCRKKALSDRGIYQMLRSNNGVDVCRGDMASQGKRGPAVDRVCAALVAAVKAGDAMSVCPAATQAGILGPNDSCEDFLLLWKGDPAACSSIKNPHQRRVCQEDAALVAGLRNPARCPESISCLVLESKKTTVCNKYRDESFRLLCARVSEDSNRSARNEQLRRLAELQKKQEVQAAYDAKIKAENVLRARIRAEAESREKAAKRQFKKNAPMSSSSEDVQMSMRRIEQGLPPLTEKELAELKRSKQKSLLKTPPQEPSQTQGR